MKFKELLDVVGDGEQVKASIIVCGVRFIATYYKKYYMSDARNLLELDVQKIESSDEELIVYLK